MRPTRKLDGFLVQKMERGLAEVILGFRRDPLVGPTITVGLGGVLAEIYKDAATRLAPVDEAEARQMIDEVKGLATIRGYRNLPQGDVAALARTIAAFSPLAHEAFAEWRKRRSIRCWSSATARASSPSTGWCCWASQATRVCAASKSWRKSSSTK